MAKIRKGILGPLSGKLGPVVGGTWKGIAYVRAVPEAKPKKKAQRTAGQIAIQEKMRFLNNFMVPFHPYINVGMKNEALSQTEISAAFTANYHHAVLGTYPDLSVDYSKFVFSKGTLPMITDIEMELSSPTTVRLTWNKNNGFNASYDDQLILVLYCRNLHQADGFAGGVKRTAAQCTFQFDDRFIGETLDVYVSITSFNRKKIADNVYLGQLAG